MRGLPTAELRGKPVTAAWVLRLSSVFCVPFCPRPGFQKTVRRRPFGQFPNTLLSKKTSSKTPSNCVPKGLQKRHSTPTYAQENKGTPDATLALLTEGL